MVSHNEYRLAERIISLSNSKDWASARSEWYLSEIYFAEDEPETCLCGHRPIIEVCVLRNRINCASAEVGNVCVNKFLGIPSKIIFDGIKRVSKDENKALNTSAADYALSKDWINDWEFCFLISTALKKNLSVNQANKRLQINRRVVNKMSKR